MECKSFGSCGCTPETGCRAGLYYRPTACDCIDTGKGIAPCATHRAEAATGALEARDRRIAATEGERRQSVAELLDLLAVAALVLSDDSATKRERDIVVRGIMQRHVKRMYEMAQEKLKEGITKE